MPQRIQRKRAKGWRMPPSSVYVGRGSIFGNPFRVGAYGGENLPPLTADQAVRRFEQWLTSQAAQLVHGVDRAR